MDSRSPVYQFFSISTKSDLWNYFGKPLILSIFLTIVFSIGRIDEVVGYLIDIVPVISSIMLGFLGMILVASLSDNSIFDRMRSDCMDIKNGPITAYRFFFIGLFFDLICFVILLAVSIMIGSFNQSFDLIPRYYFVESAVILFLLLSSSVLFIRNMDRVYQVTVHLN